jgi:hypothetical protein
MQIISNIKSIEDNGDGYYEVYWEIHANGSQAISKNQASSMEEAYEIVENMHTDELEEPALNWDDFLIYAVEDRNPDGEVLNSESY